jgi:hypothetical protein
MKSQGRLRSPVIHHGGGKGPLDGNLAPPLPPPLPPLPQLHNQHHRYQIHERRDSLFDWTDDLPNTDHVRFFRETNWGETDLGPLVNWDPVLRLYTRMVLADSRAACLWW